MKDEEIRDRWRDYFDKLFNVESEGPTLELDDFFDDTNRRFVRRIQEEEIGDALKRMEGRKAMGSHGIPIEVWRWLGDRAIVWLIVGPNMDLLLESPEVSLTNGPLD